MNQLELAFSQYLELLRQSGVIAGWAFEPETLRLAKRTGYTPDFRVLDSECGVSFYEVKGFMRDDAAVKLKVAAEMHPYRFFLVEKKKKRDGGGWDIREIEP